jgi:hypothetical protein
VLRAAATEHDWDDFPPDLSALVPEQDPDVLMDAAAYHGVVGCLYHSIRQLPGVDPAAVASLERLYHAGISHHLRILADLQAVGRLFEAAGIPWLVIKGPALAAVAYRHPDLRTYFDLDLLVPAGRFQDAVEHLEGAGFPVLDRNWQLIRHERRGQLHLQLPRGTMTDLHWHLVNHQRQRRRFQIPMPELFQRARHTEIVGIPIAVLDATDALLHVCLHASLSGGDRLIWHKDIEQAIANDPPDWEHLVARARAWQVDLPVGVILWRAASSLLVPVPTPVLEALLPSRIRRALVGLADRIVTPGSRLDEPSLGRLVSRNHGRGPLGGIQDVGRWLAHGLHGDDRDLHTNPLLQERGSPDDRAAFLAVVTGRPQLAATRPGPSRS